MSEAKRTEIEMPLVWLFVLIIIVLGLLALGLRFNPGRFIENHVVVGEMTPTHCKQRDCTEITYITKLNGSYEYESFLFDSAYDELSETNKAKLQKHIADRLMGDVVLDTSIERNVGVR